MKTIFAALFLCSVAAGGFLAGRKYALKHLPIAVKTTVKGRELRTVMSWDSTSTDMVALQDCYGTSWCVVTDVQIQPKAGAHSEPSGKPATEKPKGLELK